MTTIKFGTDGWRAIIGDDYTIENLARVAEATAQWLIKKYPSPLVVIGYDTRFGGLLFAETASRVLLSFGVKTILSSDVASTPMVSLATTEKKAQLGIVITASHNPPSYNGFKLKGPYGGPLLPEQISEIETLIPDRASTEFRSVNLSVKKEEGFFELCDIETIYIAQIEKSFDLDMMRRSKLKIAYDAMYGAGQEVMKKLFPEAVLLNCERNPGFRGRAPEPIHKNLKELSGLMSSRQDLACGIATDGDADRIGLYDSAGNFIDSHHIILLLTRYLHEHKKMNGKIVTAFSVSPKVRKLCMHYGLEYQETKIGFKYIAGHMITDDVLIGGEESGGIAVKGHIPERDGIWIGLIILEYMASTGKSLQTLIQEVYDIVGPFAFERSDLHLQEDIKQEIIAKCPEYKAFGEYTVQRIENTDGYKYFFDNDDWLMIRASGTEPVLRNYAQASTAQNAQAILKAAERTLLKIDKTPVVGMVNNPVN